MSGWQFIYYMLTVLQFLLPFAAGVIVGMFLAVKASNKALMQESEAIQKMKDAYR